MTSSTGPSPEVRAAFGLEGSAVRLPGGQGTSWRVGEVVLKPEVDAAYQEWLGTELVAVRQRGFRFPAVLATIDGQWVSQGWGAQAVVPEVAVTDGPPDWSAVVRLCRVVHQALAGMRRPEFLDVRDDPWAVADRAAWGEATVEVPPVMRDVVERLCEVEAPAAPAQLVHGDLTGNVLFSPDQVPSIIDFSPYWRPPSYAEGIIVADALCWHGASPTILEDTAVPVAAVARGLLFRALTSCRRDPGGGGLDDEAQRCRSVISALGW